MLEYEVLHGPDARYFYDSLDLLPCYLLERGLRSDDVMRVMNLSGGLEAGDRFWFPSCGVTVICREKPPIGSQGLR